MQRVVTVNLNGNAFQVEEPAFDALRAYLDRAGAALGDNPDKADIVRDLEQAIADKCVAYLGAHKTVVNAEEMGRILEEMGPVAGDGADTAAGPSPHASPLGAEPTKRLYRIRSEGSVTGVSAGLAAYFDLDVNIIRLCWIIGALVTSGFLAIPYIVLMFWMPLAGTPEQVAAAHGAPFNAQEVIDRAKRQYAEFTGPDGAAARWEREARHAWRDRSRSWSNAWTPPVAATPPTNPIGWIGRVFAGLLLIVLSILTAALTIAFVISIISLATSGAVLGWAPPFNMPFWLAIVALALVFGAIITPLSAIRDASHAAVTGAPHYHYHHGGGVVSLLVLILVAWVAYENVPSAKAAMDNMGAHLGNWFNIHFPTLRLDWDW